jgi:hypothetical protein
VVGGNAYEAVLRQTRPWCCSSRSVCLQCRGVPPGSSNSVMCARARCWRSGGLGGRLGAARSAQSGGGRRGTWCAGKEMEKRDKEMERVGADGGVGCRDVPTGFLSRGG